MPDDYLLALVQSQNTSGAPLSASLQCRKPQCLGCSAEMQSRHPTFHIKRSTVFHHRLSSTPDHVTNATGVFRKIIDASALYYHLRRVKVQGLISRIDIFMCPDQVT